MAWLPGSHEAKTLMDILIVGGTPSSRGGVELFCERARNALTEIGGHRVEWVHSNTAYLKLAALGRVLAGVRQLWRRRRQGWRFVWLQYVNLPDLALLGVCRLLGFQILVTPHLGSNWASQSKPLLRAGSLRLLGLAHGIALISDTQARELALPNAVPRFQVRTFLPRRFPAHREPARPSQGSLALVHAGRLSEGKGTFLFLEVCADLKQRGRPFQARLIGSCDAATRGRIDAAIRDNDLSSCVEVIGSLPEARLLDALCSADALVHLSEIDSFPLIVLEAIGCGVFPICKDLAGARSMVAQYCGHIVGNARAAEMAADFLAAATPGMLRDKASPAAERIAADYGWKACVAVLEQAAETVARS